VEWFKHSTRSHDDPDISEAMDEFGDKAYSIFFMVLEIYGEEFNRLKNGNLTLSKKTWMRKLRKKWKLIENILSFYAECNRLEFTCNEKVATIKIPKFIEISSNWTVRINPSPTEAPTEVPTAKEEESEEELYNNISSSNSVYNKEAKKSSNNGKLTDNDFKINFSKGNEVLALIKKIVNKPYSDGDGTKIKGLLKNMNPVIIKSIIGIAHKSKKPIGSYLWFIKSFSNPQISIPFKASGSAAWLHNCGTKDREIRISADRIFKCMGCGEMWYSVKEFEQKTGNKILTKTQLKENNTADVAAAYS